MRVRSLPANNVQSLSNRFSIHTLRSASYELKSAVAVVSARISFLEVARCSSPRFLLDQVSDARPMLAQDFCQVRRDCFERFTHVDLAGRFQLTQSKARHFSEFFDQFVHRIRVILINLQCAHNGFGTSLQSCQVVSAFKNNSQSLLNGSQAPCHVSIPRRCHSDSAQGVAQCRVKAC